MTNHVNHEGRAGGAHQAGHGRQGDTVAYSEKHPLVYVLMQSSEQYLVTKLCHQQGRGDHHQLYVHGWGGERHQGDQTVLSKARLWVPVYLQGFYSSGLLDDESVRETIEELQAAGTDNLVPAELESLISKANQIQGKHSEILDLFQIRSCTGQLLLGPRGWLIMRQWVHHCC